MAQIHPSSWNNGIVVDSGRRSETNRRCGDEAAAARFGIVCRIVTVSKPPVWTVTSFLNDSLQIPKLPAVRFLWKEKGRELALRSLPDATASIRARRFAEMNRRLAYQRAAPLSPADAANRPSPLNTPLVFEIKVGFRNPPQLPPQTALACKQFSFTSAGDKAWQKYRALSASLIGSASLSYNRQLTFLPLRLAPEHSRGVNLQKQSGSVVNKAVYSAIRKERKRERKQKSQSEHTERKDV